MSDSSGARPAFNKDKSKKAAALFNVESVKPAAHAITRFVPGVALCGVITGVAFLFQKAEVSLFGHPYIEALVAAIILGIVVRTFWRPTQTWAPGISFSGKMLLEFAVVLLGASISLEAIMASGLPLFLSILLLVSLALVASYSIGLTLGLPQRIAILIACGNSICGNSAIVAVAPVIGASSEDIASSIAFTAVLGVILVLFLPFLMPVLALTDTQYGVLAGLTVYAVPQVLAATLPVGVVSAQMGTLVKLCRVLMLAPVVLFFSVFHAKFAETSVNSAAKRPSIFSMIPWFIIGFLLLVAVRSLGLVPQIALQPILTTATVLTVISMAALGLGVDIKVIGKVGGRVTASVLLSLCVLIVIAVALIYLLQIA